MFLLETFFMLLAALIALLYRGDDVYPLFLSSGIMFATGLIFYFIGFRANEYNAGRREGMLVVASTWILLSLFGMLPFYLGGYIDNMADAFFETMSGFTSTGSTILTDIEALPHGILIWRSLTQWQGGIGIVVFTVAFIPILGGGATQMYDAESSGIMHERFRPRITQVAKRLWGVYIVLTIFLIGLLWLGPMSMFDAINHALTTISTGGYSTKNTSIAYWDSAYIEYVVMVFMMIGATNMTLIYFCFNGQPFRLLRNEEFRWFIYFVLTMVGIVTAWLIYNGFVSGFEEGWRKSSFQVITLVSSCGFITEDYISWGPFFWMIALTLMFIGGCAGSTCGGLKMARFVVLSKNLSNEFKKQTHPRAVLPVRMNGNVVSSHVVHRILAFAFIYMGLIIISAALLMLEGMAFDDGLGAAVSVVSNVGPALGKIGATGNFSDVSDLTKWFLSFLMLVGRLEIFTIVTLLLPGFWKQ